MTTEAMAAQADERAVRIVQKMHRDEKTSKAWGVRYEAAGAGWARCSMVVNDDMLNGHGTTHGGMIFSLADTEFAWACNSRNVVSVAQAANISFVSPGKPGETLVAEAREETLAGRTGVYNVRVTGGDGRVVAIFQGLSRAIRGKIIDDDDIQA